MKTIILSLLLVLSSNSAFAGKIKEIVIMTEESISLTLGLNDTALEFLSKDFVTPTQGDLAVKSVVRNAYLGETYTCLTEFKRDTEFYTLIFTKCQ